VRVPDSVRLGDFSEQIEASALSDNGVYGCTAPGPLSRADRFVADGDQHLARAGDSGRAVGARQPCGDLCPHLFAGLVVQPIEHLVRRAEGLALEPDAVGGGRQQERCCEPVYRDATVRGGTVSDPPSEG
jgi:hypothetical protein